MWMSLGRGFNESKLRVAGFIIRSYEQGQDSLAWGEISVWFLRFDTECSVCSAIGVLDRDFAVVSPNVEIIVDVR